MMRGREKYSRLAAVRPEWYSSIHAGPNLDHSHEEISGYFKGACDDIFG